MLLISALTLTLTFLRVLPWFPLKITKLYARVFVKYEIQIYISKVVVV
jgi:hypothetical protein